MKKIIILALFCSLLFLPWAFAGFNCITHEKGVKIVWFGEKGYLKFTRVTSLTSDFKVIVYSENKSEVLFSGLPFVNQKVAVPKGLKEVELKIFSGQGEVCYSRSN